MPRPSTFPEADEATGGTLAEEMQRRREAGDSFAAIARWLHATHDFTVSDETVRRWCDRLSIEKPEAEAVAG